MYVNSFVIARMFSQIGGTNKFPAAECERSFLIPYSEILTISLLILRCTGDISLKLRIAWI